MYVAKHPTREGTNQSREIGSFATPSDFETCRRIHRKFGTTYYFATRRFPKEIREHVHALYAFVRLPDEWVDNPGPLTVGERAALLSDYRQEFLLGLEGVCPDTQVLRAFCDVVYRCRIPMEEPLAFLDAMARDLTVTRYETYEDLRVYMRGSASAVGVMMCSAMGAQASPEMLRSAMALGEAMQLTNFLRDIGEDRVRGRVYLPLEDLDNFGLSADSLGAVTPEFVALMKFEIARARALYALADEGLPLLPRYAQLAVRLARVLYSRILDRIEANGYDVFTRRARTSKLEKLRVLADLLRH